ncbi:MAG: hypothetical protein ACRDSF_11000 [Pseudonocardiaceae bacterium]
MPRDRRGHACPLHGPGHCHHHRRGDEHGADHRPAPPLPQHGQVHAPAATDMHQCQQDKGDAEGQVRPAHRDREKRAEQRAGQRDLKAAGPSSVGLPQH